MPFFTKYWKTLTLIGVFAALLTTAGVRIISKPGPSESRVSSDVASAQEANKTRGSGSEPQEAYDEGASGPLLPAPTFVPKDYIKAQIPERGGWGPTCPFPSPGARCKAAFRGAAVLATRDEGRIEIMVFNGGANDPFEVVRLHARKGTNILYAGNAIEFIVPMDAEILEFQVTLLSKSGEILARTSRAAERWPVHEVTP